MFWCWHYFVKLRVDSKYLWIFYFKVKVNISHHPYSFISLTQLPKFGSTSSSLSYNEHVLLLGWMVDTSFPEKAVASFAFKEISCLIIKGIELLLDSVIK